MGGKAVLTTSEVADLLRVSEQLVRKMARQKKIPHKHLGNKIIYPVHEIEQWLAQSRENWVQDKPDQFKDVRAELETEESGLSLVE